MVAVVTVLVPHFKYPFAITATGADVVEQDTWEEVAQSVQILLTTSTGERVSVPTYGTDEIVFAQDLPTTALLSSVLEWEARAQVVFSDHPDLLDDLVRDVRVTLGVRT